MASHWESLDQGEFRSARRSISDFKGKGLATAPHWVFKYRPASLQELADFQKKFLAALKRTLKMGQFLYVLDYWHECYKFFPQSFKNADTWSHPLYTDGEDLDLFAADQSFGILTSFEQATVTVFGKPLMDLWVSPKERPTLFNVSK